MCLVIPRIPRVRIIWIFADQRKTCKLFPLLAQERLRIYAVSNANCERQSWDVRKVNCLLGRNSIMGVTVLTTYLCSRTWGLWHHRWICATWRVHVVMGAHRNYSWSSGVNCRPSDAHSPLGFLCQDNRICILFPGWWVVSCQQIINSSGVDRLMI